MAPSRKTEGTLSDTVSADELSVAALFICRNQIQVQSQERKE